jgi:hypothetical protein
MSYIIYLKGREAGIVVEADKEEWGVSSVGGLSHTAVSVLRLSKDGSPVAEFVREDVLGWQLRSSTEAAHRGTTAGYTMHQNKDS